MASARIMTVGAFVLIFSQAISSTAAEFKEHDDMVPNSDDQFETTSCSGLSPTLGNGCTISDDCSTITCKMNFADQPITFKLKVNKCDEPVTVTASMDVPDLDITWSHTYTSGGIIAVPGFTVSLPSFFSAGVYVQIDITDNGDTLHLKVNLLEGGEIMGKTSYPFKVTVIEGDLPISTDECGFFAWWFELDVPAKIAVVAGSIVFLISICCCCCCCYWCRRSRRSSNQGTVIVTPGFGPTAVMATSTKSTVPMRPLVEEE